MKLPKWIVVFGLGVFVFLMPACKKAVEPDFTAVTPALELVSGTIDGKSLEGNLQGFSPNPMIRLRFSQAVHPASVLKGITLSGSLSKTMALYAKFSYGDSVLELFPTQPLPVLEKFSLQLNASLQSAKGGGLKLPLEKHFSTAIDSSRKFPAISDSALLTKVQEQTFRYFWDFGHPVSGLARERSNGHQNLVTIGGSGFGVMAIIVGMERKFISRAQGLQRLQLITEFLKNKAQTFQGAFSHWLNGTTGEVMPFSVNDNGADLVETAFLIQGLMAARQYFNEPDAAAQQLRADIGEIIDRVNWSWFQQNNPPGLYWHWSPDKGWAMNLKIQGWNESLITYILAAGATTHGMAPDGYVNGWARNGAMKNGKTFFGLELPLGPDFGGPLFFAHYSFLGLNPFKMSDAYADYGMQNTNHARIQYNYSKANPKGYYGYSDSVWGLTASDTKNGYSASSPLNDLGFIAPTAALASFPYTPEASMAALHFYYYVLGNLLWKEYGFVDAFSLDVLQNDGAWFAPSFLAIDQGPIIIMIENYRTGLIWRLVMADPQIQRGLQKLNFTIQ